MAVSLVYQLGADIAPDRVDIHQFMGSAMGQTILLIEIERTSQSRHVQS